MSHDECADLGEDIAELALGTLTGRERASAIAHLDGCNTCRRHLDMLAHTADMLLHIAPEAEPPPGLKDRILARIHHDRHRRPRATIIVSVAAALALLLAAGGATAFSIAANTRSATRTASIAQRVHVAQFVASAGEHVTGRVLSAQGDEAWLFMVVDDTSPNETYACQLWLTDGRRLTIGSFALHNGDGAWGHTLNLNPLHIRSVQLLDSDGNIAATAAMH